MKRVLIGKGAGTRHAQLMAVGTHGPDKEERLGNTPKGLALELRAYEQEMQTDQMQESSDFPHELAVLEGYRISMLPGAAPLRMLYDIQEDVARRLALRLHDESAQALATASVELAEIATQCPEQIVSQLNTVVSRLEDVAEQLRRHSHELHPLILDRRGLMPALQLMACSVRARASLEVVVSGRTPEVPIKGQEIVLYRVVQEALANVVRHAGATEVRVLVDHDDSRIFCSVKDNGIGLKPSSSSAEVHGLGMVGIHERVAAVGGTCRIISSWGRGLELQVEIPL